MITEQTNTAVNNTGMQSGRYEMAITPQMFKVFYSSLYEDKETAVLRELGANAVDAHIAAGIPETPIYISLPNSLVPELIVQDFGIGMSTEFIEQHYTVYGDSSKRTSNNEIGGFGYGAKSPLSLAPSFTVESTHNDVTTSLVTYVDKDGPRYVITSRPAGDSKSGTIVRVPISDEVVQRALKQKALGSLFKYWTVPPVFDCGSLVGGPTIIEERPEYCLLSGGGRVYSLTTVTVGPFEYRIPVNMIARLEDWTPYKVLKQASRGVYDLPDVNFVLKFGIGELELPPSRERIEDTAENEEAIRAKIQICYDKVTCGKNVTFVESVEQAHEFLQKNGIKFGDLYPGGTAYDDMFVGVKNPHEFLKAVLSERDTIVSVLGLRAMLVQYNHIQETMLVSDVPHPTKTAVPFQQVAKYTAASQGFGTRAVYAPNVVDRTVILPTTAELLAALLRQPEFQAEIHGTETTVTSVVSTRMLHACLPFALLQRQYGSKRYTIQRYIDTGAFETVVAVPEKRQAQLSRILNANQHSWGKVAVVFKEIAEELRVFFKNCAEHTQQKFNVVDEEGLLKALADLPKTSRTYNATTATTKSKTVKSTAFNVGKVYCDVNKHDSDLEFITNEDVLALMANHPVVLVTVSDYYKSSCHTVLDQELSAARNITGLRIVYISDTTKKQTKVQTFWDSLKNVATADNPNNATYTTLRALPAVQEARKQVIRATIVKELKIPFWVIPETVKEVTDSRYLNSHEYLNKPFADTTDEETYTVYCLLYGLLRLSCPRAIKPQQLFTSKQLKLLKKSFDNYINQRVNPDINP